MTELELDPITLARLGLLHPGCADEVGRFPGGSHPPLPGAVQPTCDRTDTEGAQ